MCTSPTQSLFYFDQISARKAKSDRRALHSNVAKRTKDYVGVPGKLLQDHNNDETLTRNHMLNSGPAGSEGVSKQIFEGEMEEDWEKINEVKVVKF